jgi:cold shock CspA family protein
VPQGTIKDYDPAKRAGLLLDDHKTEFAFDFDSFRGSGVRLFRIGQRVKYSVVGEGPATKVRNLTLVTL